MTSKNDITGDSIKTKVVSDSYRDNYDLIFGKKKKSTLDMQMEDEAERLEIYKDKKDGND